MELIDRNAVLNRYREICGGVACLGCPFYKDGCALEKLILDIKPISRGKWIYKECEGVGYFVCSECGQAIWIEKDNHYCFNCGTKMDLGEIEE